MSGEIENIRKRGIVVETAVDANRILGLINKLKPIQTQYELMRVGHDREGGYLIPDELDKPCNPDLVDIALPDIWYK